MDERTITKLVKLAREKIEIGDIVASRKIAELLEPAPETIAIAEAVKKLVEYFEAWDITFTNGDLFCGLTARASWTWHGCKKPDWVKAIINGGETPEAIKVGLEDLFISILEEAKNG